MANVEGRIRPHITHYWTEEQIKEFFDSLYERAKTDSKIAVWVGDQLSGKAQQAIDLTSGGKPLLISNDE